MKNKNLILGKISTGKTSNIIFPEVEKLIDEGKNIIIVDNKEEYYKTYMKDLKEKGYKTYVINFKDSEKSNGFNPLLLPYKLYKNNKKDIAVKIVEEIALEIIKNDKAIDPFWQDSASTYFIGLTLLLFKNAKEEEINLGSVQMILSQTELNKENQERFKNYINTLDIVSLEYILLAGTAFAPAETRGGIISVLKQELNKYIAKENLLNLLCTNELDLSNINEKTAIFVITNNDYTRLVNVLLDQVMLIDNTNFNYILDNFDSLTKVLELENLLDLSNDNKIYVVSRNIEALKDKHGKFISDKFENIVEAKEGEYSLNKIGNYNEYPKIDKIKHNYFNFIEFMNKND